jgi:TonB family protein
MNTKLHLVLVLMFARVPLCAAGTGQSSSSAASDGFLRVDTVAAMKNLLTELRPVYPTEAKQLHIQGAVELELTVSPQGDVVAERVIAGPPAFRESAMSAFRKMKYRPFLLDGKPAVALVQARVNYEMAGAPLSNEDQRAGELFFPVHSDCENLKHRQAKNAIEICGKALALSKGFSAGSQLEARTVAYSDLAQLLVKAQRVQEAAPLGDEVVALVSGTEEISQAFATAYMTRSYTRAANGDYEGSDADCTRAEHILETLATNEKEPVFIKMFDNELRDSLKFHSVLVEMLGDKKRAQTLREAASKL